MNYVVLDLEWNQPLSPQRMIRKPIRLSGEIVQCGAVKIDFIDAGYQSGFSVSSENPVGSTGGCAGCTSCGH